MRRRHYRALALLGFTLVLALAGCGQASSGTAASTPVPADFASSSAGTVTVVVAQKVDGMEALISGRLEVVDGCLGLHGQLAVFPMGTTVVRQEPLQIDVPGYGTYEVGDEVAFAGGDTTLIRDDQGRLTAAGAPLPEPCTDSSVFILH